MDVRMEHTGQAPLQLGQCLPIPTPLTPGELRALYTGASCPLTPMLHILEWLHLLWS